jgi:uncharacterized membrane-anchored protein
MIFTIRWLWLICVIMLSQLAFADEPPGANQERLTAAFQAAEKAATKGPAVIKLLDEANLTLPDGEWFVPAAEAERIMDALGNGTSSSTDGLILSPAADSQWMVVVNWVKEGYVRDGDAKEWQADSLLESVREATEKQNEERVRRGLPALDIVGWIEPPTYDGKAHRLVWSISARDRGAPADVPQTINYNTFALGRDGFFSLGLITDSASIGVDKAVVRQLLDHLIYVPGKGYNDFDQSTDRVAAYGLTALVGAVAVHKLGLLAVIGVFLLKAWKLGLVGLAAAAAVVRRFVQWRRPPAEKQ